MELTVLMIASGMCIHDAKYVNLEMPTVLIIKIRPSSDRSLAFHQCNCRSNFFRFLYQNLL